VGTLVETPDEDNYDQLVGEMIGFTQEVAGSARQLQVSVENISQDFRRNFEEAALIYARQQGLILYREALNFAQDLGWSPPSSDDDN